MKKTAILLLLACITASAGAQTMYDAFNYSKSNYVGTARTAAMGNAFTALGGDIGAVSINPAGSAVARYSQISVTPGISISTNTAMGTTTDWFEKNLRTSMTRFAMPNFGFTINFETPRISGLKNWSIGFIGTRTDTYQDDMMASGSNANTSFAGSLATLANGYDSGVLLADDAYDNIPVNDWRAILAHRTHIASLVPLLPGQDENNAPTNEYIGVTENAYLNTDEDGNQYFIMKQGGPIDQTFARRTLGSKYDYVINLGGNFSDVVFVGANLGITSLRYSHQYYIRETAQDPTFFETEFDYLKYGYGYDATGTAVYGKFGIIVTPGAGLRLGAAIQTPSSITINESWSMSAEHSSYNSEGGSETSPDGEYSYRILSPFRFNVGAALTFGDLGLISIDYERCNYGSMRFSELRSNDNTAFEDVNADIRNTMGVSHEVRAGIEVKPLPELAVRAGYSLITSALPSDVDYQNQFIWERTDGDMHNFSLGLGYSSKGSFFADLAVRLTKYADTWIYPYEYYVYDDDWNQYVDANVLTPEIISRRMLWNVMLTLGLRF